LVTTKIQSLIDEVLAANGYELIEAEYLVARKIWRVFIDRPQSCRGLDLITVEDCGVASGLIEDVLIDADASYEHLEVSSPGMDRALTKPDHFSRFSGEHIRLVLEPPVAEMRKIVGVLVGLENDEILVDVDAVTHRIPYANVTRARVVPQF
jgi:ribosome maturation factor RimP